ENEFKIEIERRFEYVNRYLKEGPIPGYKTDRGRLYLILGPPTNRLENSLNTSFAREIWWYFANSDIYARFVDANGNGIYYMDTNWVSLKLLDEMERRKYYIVNKDEKENFETALLKFSLKYRPESKEVQINVNTRNLSYNESENSDVMISRIKVNLVVYDNKNKFFTHTEVKTIEISKEELLEKKSTVTFMVPLDLPKGKVKIDAIVTDFLGDAVMRKFFKIKN
ncbi:MAG: GWxTD domain-containing protein, partial [bacterium]|nr:GWxTD domain-containing protein [bacterium]